MLSMNRAETDWLLLIVSLPSESGTARMRIWRGLKALGCGLLRDGAYLLPANETHQQRLRDYADEVTREGGTAWVMAVQTHAEVETIAYQALFDRTAEYVELNQTLLETKKSLSGMSPQDIARASRKLRRDYEALRSIDYFPNEASAQTEAAWNDFNKTAEAALSPGEPHAADKEIARLNPKEYLARTWATRRHLWVDRVASAWLIRKFIDRKAKFLWLESPSDCPSDALGFDFDNAAFTHVGSRVTFEVLMASFGLESDQALLRIATMIHMLDVGEGFVPEASGFEAILSGARQSTADDNQLLTEMSLVLDALYTHFAIQS
jgi:hypothetical protein